MLGETQVLNCAQIFQTDKIPAWRDSRRGYQTRDFFYPIKFFDASAPLSERVRLCRCPEGAAKANGLGAALAEGGTGGGPRAVYVIGVEGEKVCKIGVSNAPVRRWADLQASHYKELFLFGALYMAGNRKCESVEAEALSRAEKVSDWRRGEWVGLEPEHAFDMVIQSADDLKIRNCDPATWVVNMHERTRALAKATFRRAA